MKLDKTILSKLEQNKLIIREKAEGMFLFS